jgi:hypothetical protein
MAFNLAAALANSYKSDKSISDANRRATIQRLEQIYNNVAQDLYGANNFNQLFDTKWQQGQGAVGTALGRHLANQFGVPNYAATPSWNQPGSRYYFDANTGRWMGGTERFNNNRFEGYDYSTADNIETEFVKNLVTQLSDPYLSASRPGQNTTAANQYNKLINDKLLAAVGNNANVANSLFGTANNQTVLGTDWAGQAGTLGDLYARGGYVNDNVKGLDSLYQPFVNQQLVGALGNGNQSLYKLGNYYRDMFSGMGFTDKALEDVTNRSVDAAKYGLGIDTSKDLSAQWNMLSNTLKGTPGGGGLTDFSRWLQNYNTGGTNTGTTNTGTTNVYTTGTGTTGTGTTNTTGTTGNTNTGGVTNNTYQMYPQATSRQDMNRGSRYFDTTSGAYNNMYPSLGNIFQQGQGQGSF